MYKQLGSILDLGRSSAPGREYAKVFMAMLAQKDCWEGYFAVVLGEAVARETQDTSRNTACCGGRKPGPTLFTCWWKLESTESTEVVFSTRRIH